MSWQQIKALKEQRGEVMNSMKAILTKADGEKRNLTNEEDAKFNELNTRCEDMAKDITRREQLYALEQATQGTTQNRSATQPGRDDLNSPEQAADAKAKEYRNQFGEFLRTGTLAPMETRALTVSGMGVVGDRPFYAQLVSAMKAYTGIRDAGATVLPTSDGNPLTIPLMNDTTNVGRLVGEAATNATATDPGAPGNLTLNGYKFDSDWIKLSLELIQDAAFPAEAHVVNMAAERIGRALNNYLTTGTGSGQPSGFAYAGTTGKTLASKDVVTYEEVVDFIHSLDAAYRNTGKCSIQLHDTTLAALRKLKTGTNGFFIWSPGEAGQPNSILGFNYTINNALGQLGTAGATLAAFVDPTRYFIRDVAAPIIIRADELFASDGLVGYKVFSRHDGGLADTAACKLLKAAAA